MKVETYNFRKPGPLATDLEQRLAAWLREGCTRASEADPARVAVRLEMTFSGLDTVRPADGLARLADAALGYRIAMGAGGMMALLVMPRTLALALVAAAQGDTAGEPPADRPLTAVEDALAEYLIQHLLLAVFQEAWPGGERLELEVLQKEPQPKRCRIFSPDQNVVVCTFSLNGPLGGQKWQWMLPQAGLLEHFARAAADTDTPSEAAARPRLEMLIRDLPVQMSVTLGTAELPISQLAKLRPGDLVILNQRVSDPLIASVAREAKFRVWPGRVGAQQAFQVESLLEC